MRKLDAKYEAAWRGQRRRIPCHQLGVIQMAWAASEVQEHDRQARHGRRRVAEMAVLVSRLGYRR